MKFLWFVGGLLAFFQGVRVLSAAEEARPPSGGPDPAKPRRPNIVVILADDLGYSDLGCYGSEISTPNLDRLAAKGIQLAQFYTTPRCCPSRASLLTGLYAHQAGIGDMMQDRGVPGYRGELDKHNPTVAEQLRLAGYHTMMVGKWHVSHVFFKRKSQLNHETDEPFWDNKEDWPLQRGFDEYFGTIHGVTSYYDPFSLVNGDAPVPSVATSFYYTDAITDQAVADLASCSNRNRPFFLYVAFTAPHWPLQAPEADIARYRSTYLAGWDVIRSNRYERQIKSGLIPRAWRLSPRDERVPPWEQVRDKAWEANRMATYAAMVEHLDHGVGRILSELETTGAGQNTLVMFFLDNGACDEVIQPDWYDVPSRTRDGRAIKVGNQNHSAFAGPDNVWQSYGPPWANVSDTPFRLYKHFVHEGGIASPFIAYWPNGLKPPGELNRDLAHVTDIMATCTELAGAQRPVVFNGSPTLPLEGVSLSPLFSGHNRTNSIARFWEHEGNRAARLGKWKLVCRYPGRWELYNTETDRTELHDLAEKNPEMVKQIAALYEEWASRCNVLPREKLPPIKPAGSPD